MYYILERRYLLRGWDRLPYAVVDGENGAVRFLSKQDFDTLMACDGTIDFSLPVIPSYMRESLEGLRQAGFIRECQRGEALDERQMYRRYPNRFMAAAQWSITGGCNCRCRHCFMSAPDAKHGEPSHEDVMTIARELSCAGIMRVSITGGEPLIRRDFWDIVDALREGGVVVTDLSTNGLLVDEQLLSKFEERNLRPTIALSFDGLGFHDWLRGMDGAEEAVRRAFELCRDRGFATSAAMCLWRDNVCALGESIDYLASVGCSSLKVQHINELGAWSESGHAVSRGLSQRETFEAMLSYLSDFYRKLPAIRLNLGGFFSADGRHPDEYSLPFVNTCDSLENVCLCTTARTNMYITAEGRPAFCMGVGDLDDSQNAYPTIMETGMSACLADSAYMQLNDTRVSAVISHNEGCATCRHRLLCLGGCRAYGIMSHPGDLLGIDEEVCTLYSEGWAARVVEEVRRLRPSARCAELEWLSERGREGELM